MLLPVALVTNKTDEKGTHYSRPSAAGMRMSGLHGKNGSCSPVVFPPSMEAGGNASKLRYSVQCLAGNAIAYAGLQGSSPSL